MTVLARKRARIKYSRSETRAAWILLLPSVIGLVCITYVPMIASFALSLFDWNGLGAMKYIGLDNYIRLFTRDTKFFGSLATTLEYAAISVFGSIVYSMIVAMLLNRKVPARGFFRAVFYLPYVLPALAVYLGWKWLYDYNHGFFNYVIKLTGGTSLKFLDSSALVTPSLSFIAVWLSGNLIVIFLAGLQNVPRTYHVAAEIDGANAWQRFWNITIPCMALSGSDDEGSPWVVKQGVDLGHAEEIRQDAPELRRIHHVRHVRGDQAFAEEVTVEDLDRDQTARDADRFQIAFVAAVFEVVDDGVASGGVERFDALRAEPVDIVFEVA